MLMLRLISSCCVQSLMISFFYFIFIFIIATVNSTVNYFPTQIEPEKLIDHFHGVPIENHAFIGRLDILRTMEVEFNKASSHSCGCKVLVLSGLGGMGKTQLMLRYS